MRKFIIVIVVILAVAAAAYILGSFYPIGSAPGPVAATATPRPFPGALPTATPKPAPATLLPPGATAAPGTPRPPTPIPSLTPFATTPLPPPTPRSVSFEIAITNVTGSGLSRTATTELTNSGNIDAHNVWAKVEVFVGNNRIRVSGQDFLRQDVGTLNAGETVTRQTTLSFGIFDGANIMRNGARIVLTMYSDEKTETLTYDYKP